MGGFTDIERVRMCHPVDLRDGARTAIVTLVGEGTFSVSMPVGAYPRAQFFGVDSGDVFIDDFVGRVNLGVSVFFGTGDEFSVSQVDGGRYEFDGVGSANDLTFEFDHENWTLPLEFLGWPPEAENATIESSQTLTSPITGEGLLEVINTYQYTGDVYRTSPHFRPREWRPLPRQSLARSDGGPGATSFGYSDSSVVELDFFHLPAALIWEARAEDAASSTVLYADGTADNAVNTYQRWWRRAPRWSDVTDPVGAIVVELVFGGNRIHRFLGAWTELAQTQSVWGGLSDTPQSAGERYDLSMTIELFDDETEGL